MPPDSADPALPAGADEAEFARSTEQFRPELLRHCYRMIGSVEDAEDVVQETYLRAWRAYQDFEGRSSVRTWLYRIATNTCLTALQHHSRRVLPSGLGAPNADPDAPPVLAGAEVRWLEPVPDALALPEHEGPAAIVAARESLRLALIVSLQLLPPRQRAIFILRDVLAFKASEIAQLLDTTTGAVKTALQRARGRLAEQAPASVEQVAEPDEPETNRLLREYIQAFETSDLTSLENLLRQDATLEMVPSTTWFAGNRVCLPYIARHAIGGPGDWRLVPTRANGQPAALAYLRGPDGRYRVFAVAVLRLAGAGIAGIVLFTDPAVIARFGQPAVLAPAAEGTPSG